MELIASIGVRTLAQLADVAESRGGRLTVVDPSPVVRHVLTVTGLDHRLGID